MLWPLPQQAQIALSVIMYRSHPIQCLAPLTNDLLSNPNFSHNLLQSINQEFEILVLRKQQKLIKLLGQVGIAIVW